MPALAHWSAIPRQFPPRRPALYGPRAKVRGPFCYIFLTNEGKIIDLGKFTAPIRDARLARSRVIPVDIQFITRLLQLDGSVVLSFEGWPPQGEVLAYKFGFGQHHETGALIPRLELVVYSPTFPAVPTGVSPGLQEIRYTARQIDETDAEPAQSAAQEINA